MTSDEVKWVMSHDPERLYAIRSNNSDPYADELFQTEATYASALTSSQSGIEIALRQNPSNEWRRKCRERQVMAAPASPRLLSLLPR